jgi:hypothetical protein
MYNTGTTPITSSVSLTDYVLIGPSWPFADSLHGTKRWGHICCYGRQWLPILSAFRKTCMLGFDTINTIYAASNVANMLFLPGSFYLQSTIAASTHVLAYTHILVILSRCRCREQCFARSGLRVALLAISPHADITGNERQAFKPRISYTHSLSASAAPFYTICSTQTSTL